MQFQMRTETMQISLPKPISFSQSNNNVQGSPQIEKLQCYGGVTIDERSLDQQQRLCAYDRMQVTDLAINVLSGAMNAGGPGWLNSVRVGSGNPLSQTTPNQPLPTPPGSAGDQINCLTVRFQKQIAGNVLQRRLTFSDQVELAYAPVDQWDAMLVTNDPTQLGPRGVVAECDRLSVNQMLNPFNNQRSVELVAEDNVVVENNEFTARGNRIAFAEAKDVVVLEGDGRNKAQLYRQLQVGGKRDEFAGQKVTYWLKTKQVKVDGAQLLQSSAPVDTIKTK
jgi:hypothetical protein